MGRGVVKDTGEESIGQFARRCWGEFVVGSWKDRLIAVALGYAFIFEGSRFMRSIWPSIWESVADNDHDREFWLVCKCNAPQLFCRFIPLTCLSDPLLGVASWAVPFAVVWLSNAFFAILYITKLPMCERYRIQKKWPWEGGEKARKEWRSMCLKSIALVLFNQLVVALPAALLNFNMQLKFGATASPGSMPSPWTIMGHLAVFMAIEDTLFYWGHRTLHHRSACPMLPLVAAFTTGVVCAIAGPFTSTFTSCTTTTIPQ